MKVRDVFFMTIAMFTLFISSLLSKQEGKYHMRINTTHRIEALVMTETCGFSPAVADYLVSWINDEAEALESYRTVFGAQKAATSDALDRLERSKIKIQTFKGSVQTLGSASEPSCSNWGQVCP